MPRPLPRVPRVPYRVPPWVPIARGHRDKDHPTPIGTYRRLSPCTKGAAATLGHVPGTRRAPAEGARAGPIAPQYVWDRVRLSGSEPALGGAGRVGHTECAGDMDSESWTRTRSLGGDSG
eukprot:2102766-Rhodomonas_salina.1